MQGDLWGWKKSQRGMAAIEQRSEGQVRAERLWRGN
jgi:hypothetical protein